ncbi:MAG: outer membrane lipoprotein-sorting protein [Pseudomonadota bacterium]
MFHSKFVRAALILTASVAVTPAVAQDQPAADTSARGETEASQKGYDLAARSDRSDLGFGDSEVSAQMTLQNAAGQTTTRELFFRTLEKEDESVGDKSLVVFKSPRDVEGTALLSHAKILDPDDQWLFLPALKRVKRISSANKSGPFVGSEFAFEDFTAVELNKYTYKYLGEEEIDGVMMDKVERFPRYENSGYTRQIGWTDQDIFQIHKVEFYDRKNELLKTLTLTDYREYDGIWRSHKFSMVNHRTNKKTDIVYGDYTFKTGLDSGDFVKGVLSRIR